MEKPKVCVIRTDGTNCDRETKHAFELVGGNTDIVHMNTLIKGYDPASKRKVKLSDYDILAIPGGFSNGDYIAAGRIFSSDLEHFLGDEINEFASSDKLIIGICNGFQALVKYGLLPQLDGRVEQTTTLTYNDSGRFRCDWVNLVKPDGNGEKCIWTRGIESIDLPIAHGEGKFNAEARLMDRLFRDGQVVFQYADNQGNPTMDHPENPNGSLRSIAGICDPSGQIFGLMPHPERYWKPGNHRLYTKQKIDGTAPSEGLGLQIFRKGVEYFR
ncbi:phosphoribosylformylglycinamidine synthase I [Candidatus Pacearchaeota archaeon]|nr:phosphoribosylformylglycinamidine synthase I [Candidatus Pacearchaeota archaeon]